VAENRPVIRAFGQEAHVLVSSEETGDAFCVLRVFATAGNVTPPHLHRATDETFLIESGEIEVNLGGKLLHGRKGDVIYLPEGIPHGPRAIGNDSLTVVVLWVSGGFDRFFAACGQEFKNGEPEFPVIAKLAAEYGIEFQIGPPACDNRHVAADCDRVSLTGPNLHNWMAVVPFFKSQQCHAMRW
jgi:quercetin dioxygenase-like cupin family protein